MILGQLLDREAVAKEQCDVYASALEDVYRKIAALPDSAKHKTVYMELGNKGIGEYGNSYNKGGCQLNNDAISFQLPLTWNLAKSAIVRSTISRVLDTTIDFLLKRANQCLCLPLFCSRYTVCDLL